VWVVVEEVDVEEGWQSRVGWVYVEVVDEVLE
jgi:hypothetical protein